MSTVALPNSLHDRALAIIGRELRWTPSLKTPLAEFGTAALCDVLIALETRLGVALDIDEVMDCTVAQLLGLVEAKVRWTPQGVTPREACRLYDFASQRARRARGEAAPERPPAVQLIQSCTSFAFPDGEFLAWNSDLPPPNLDPVAFHCAAPAAGWVAAPPPEVQPITRDEVARWHRIMGLAASTAFVAGLVLGLVALMIAKGWL
jgi:hypothetical protein